MNKPEFWLAVLALLCGVGLVAFDRNEIGTMLIGFAIGGVGGHMTGQRRANIAAGEGQQ